MPTVSEHRIEHRPVDDLEQTPGNPKGHSIEEIRASMLALGFTSPALLDDRTGRIIAGHGRRETLLSMQARGDDPPRGIKVDDRGRWLVPVITGWASENDAEAQTALLGDNQLTILGGWVPEDVATMLGQIADVDPALVPITGFPAEEIEALLAGGHGFGKVDSTGPSLADRFLIPPFDVLDARQGWWQERKRTWIALGIKSEIGRPASTDREGDEQRPASKGLVLGSASGRDPDYYRKKEAAEARLGRSLTNAEFEAEFWDEPDYHGGSSLSTSGTSVFDPVLTELAVRWYSPIGGHILDPFAGGSVRGLVAAMLGRNYLGIDLRPEQIAANEEQRADFAKRGLLTKGRAKSAPPRGKADWLVGDARDVLQTLPERHYDLALTCPPYFDLEVYGDDEADLSTMSTEDFTTAYGEILGLTYSRLRDNAYAVIVVGDARDSSGHLRDLSGLTTRLAEQAGFTVVSNAVLITPVGSLPVRAARQFVGSRVLGRTHQDVVVLAKGSRSLAAQQCGPVDVSEALALADDPQSAGVAD